MEDRWTIFIKKKREEMDIPNPWLVSRNGEQENPAPSTPTNNKAS